MGEGDQVREDQTGVRRGITVSQSLRLRADEVRESGNGTSPPPSRIITSASEAEPDMRRCFGPVASDAFNPEPT